MLILIILLPILGFFSGIFFGRWLGGKGVGVIATTSILLVFFISVCILLKIILYGTSYKLSVFRWFFVDTLNVTWALYVDSITAVMLIVVSFISLLVHYYSLEYMREDPHLSRFMSYLSLFTFFMLILITANNFLQMFVGWEGVGISSFLLINFWFTRLQANKAAIKAMLINRVGDLALLLAIFCIYFCFNTLDYDIVFNQLCTFSGYKLILYNISIPVIDYISILLLIGAMGKSAQIGLHTWLPDAMEGPTPVSALIHAATMVTAGVFLIARCSYIFEFSSFCLIYISIVGATTAIVAATIGLFQNDLKKVIAYSTCSQLGYMVFSCGFSGYEVGLFHLSNHAFFKALLFLGAGSIIHALADEQDLRKMGGLKRVLPFSYSVMLIGSLALIGFPFFSGFYSKDIILELAAAKNSTIGAFSFILGSFAAFCTSYYSLRILYMVFLSQPLGDKKKILLAHEGGHYMTIPLLLLGIFSITIGYISKELFIGFGTDFWKNSIFILPFNYTLSDIEFLQSKIKLIPLIMTMLGSISAFYVYEVKIKKYFNVKRTVAFNTIFVFFNRKWLFDRLYTNFLSQNYLKYSILYFYKIIDRGLLEFLGPYGITKSILLMFIIIRPYQSGYLIEYIRYTAIFLFLLLLLLFNQLFLFYIVLSYYIYIFLLEKAI